MNMAAVEPISPKWLTADEVARICRTSSKTVRNWTRAKANPLPAFRSPGARGMVLVREDRLQQWMEEQHGERVA